MLTTRKANQSDSQDIFDWRNDELTRLMSHTSNLVGWDEHQAWFKASLMMRSRLLVMCEDQGLTEKVAVVRFDVMNGRALISINLSPRMRGRGWRKLV